MVCLESIVNAPILCEVDSDKGGIQSKVGAYSNFHAISQMAYRCVIYAILGVCYRKYGSCRGLSLLTGT